MPDITNGNLPLAFLDQKVAGMFAGKRYAYIAVAAGNGWQLGIAVSQEQGYSPISGVEFDSWDEATKTADGMNDHIGISEAEATLIQVSTMRR